MERLTYGMSQEDEGGYNGIVCNEVQKQWQYQQGKGRTPATGLAINNGARLGEQPQASPPN